MNTGVDTAVIPLAGLATRMQPLARSVPKEMLPLGDRPVLHTVVEELVAAGIEHIVLVLGSRSEAIERYFHAIPELDRRLRERGLDWPAASLWSSISHCSFSIVRQDRPCGIIDAIRRAHRVVGARRYLVHMGDSIIWRDSGLLSRVITCHEATGADATIAVSQSLPHVTSTRAVVQPRNHVVGVLGEFEVERIMDDQMDNGGRPFVIGRYLVEGPMLLDDMTNPHHRRLGELTSLLHVGDRASVMAVPMMPEERLLGSGTMEEYLESWRLWLDGDR